jgi:hypothetical protein
MSEQEPKKTNWVVEEKDLKRFFRLALEMNLIAQVIAFDGDCMEIGSAEALIAEDQYGVELIAPGNELYMDFCAAFLHIPS